MIRVKFSDGDCQEMCRREMPAVPRLGEVVTLLPFPDGDPDEEHGAGGEVDWIEWNALPDRDYDVEVCFGYVATPQLLEKLKNYEAPK